MSVFVVLIRQNLTACDTVFRGASTQRTLSEHVFNTQPEAESFYNQQKSMLRFSGVAGQYVTYPTEHESYQVHTHSCDYCQERFTPEENDPGFTDLDGDFCSRSCFRNNFQASRSEDSYDEEQYYDDY